MMASTIWLIVSLVLLYNVHPITAALLALPWFAHRRWEQSKCPLRGQKARVQ